MAAPTPSARVAPTDIMLENGYRSLVTFAADTNIDLWEKTVTPSGDDGGDPIDISTMWNVDYRTKAPRALNDKGELKMVCGYSPLAKSQIEALINVRTTITETYPDGSTYCYYGYLRQSEFGPLEEGTHPEVTITVVPTNYDPTNHVEAAPVLTNVSGT